MVRSNIFFSMPSKSKHPVDKTSVLPLLLIFSMMINSGCSTLYTDNEDSIIESEMDRQSEALALREQQLKSIKTWVVNARFSFVTDSEAWSGKLTWQQELNNGYFIHFSDPAGQGVMQLVGNDELVELRLADGNIFQATDAETLLRQETNWNLPIKSLWYWIRALPDRSLPLTSELDAEGLPVKFDQQGWTVDFQSYHQVDNRYFPRKIVIKKDDLKLKLIIMNWMVE